MGNPPQQQTTTAQEPGSTIPTATPQAPATAEGTSTPAETKQATLPPGKKEKVSGVIVRREPDSFVLREDNGRDVLVKLTNSTKVEEKKGNPFRGAKHYAATQLLRGLNVEVDGRADTSGALVADKIKFTKNEYETAQSVESRVTPVEGRLGTAETRLSQSEQNAQRMAGQIEELNSVANAATSSAKTAQQTANTAVAGVQSTNQRISEIDDYQPQKTVTIHFKVNSAVLSPEAKAHSVNWLPRPRTKRVSSSKWPDSPLPTAAKTSIGA